MSVAAEPQHLTALEQANRIRLARSEARRELQALGDHTASRAALADLLESMPEWLESAPIGQVLTWPHGAGDDFARRACLKAAEPCNGVGAPSELTPVGDLTLRQLEALERWLRRPKGAP